MSVSVIDHPLAQHYLTHLRDATTKPALFRTITRKLTTLIVLEATRDLRTAQTLITTPMEEMWSPILDDDLVAVPILRAGLGMLDAVVDLFPDVAVGTIGLERDDDTAKANSYYLKLPKLRGRTVLLLDPMLATGGSAENAVRSIAVKHPDRIVMLCVIAAPQGLERLQQACPDLDIFTCAVDRDLNDRKYILPGVGDFGDRLYGTF